MAPEQCPNCKFDKPYCRCGYDSDISLYSSPDTRGTNSQQCPVCGGAKTVEINPPMGLSSMLRPCGRCDGKGSVPA